MTLFLSFVWGKKWSFNFCFHQRSTRICTISINSWCQFVCPDHLIREHWPWTLHQSWSCSIWIFECKATPALIALVVGVWDYCNQSISSPCSGQVRLIGRRWQTQYSSWGAMAVLWFLCLLRSTHRARGHLTTGWCGQGYLCMHGGNTRVQYFTTLVDV